MNRKLMVALIVLFISSTCIFLFWQQTFLLVFLLILIAYIKQRVFPIKKELFWFILICLVSAVVEMIFVNYAQAWSYSRAQMFGIPIFMPLYWGILGTTTVVIYNELVK